MRQEFHRMQDDSVIEEQRLRKLNAAPGRKYRKPLVTNEQGLPVAMRGGLTKRMRHSKAKITLATHA